MSTNPDLLQQSASPLFEFPATIHDQEVSSPEPQENPRAFAEEQMRSLVRQVFCPGWPRPSRQVMMCAVDAQVDSSDVCLQAGQALSEMIEASIGIVQVDPQAHPPVISRVQQSPARGGFGVMRSFSHQVSTNLWQVPFSVFIDEQNAMSGAWFRNRLAELRLEFDYTILQGPAAAVSAEASLLGHLSDGVILVLEAGSTRRLNALRAKERLQSAGVRILGAVLTERRFPIPKALYDRL